MNKPLCRWCAVALTAGLALLFLQACNKSEETPTNPAATTVAGPSNLQAYSVDSTKVGLTWTVSPDEAKAELLNYAITVRETTGTLVNTLSAVKGMNSMQVMSLVEGTIYVFTIKSNVAAGSVTNDSSSVRWSPAKRFDLEGSAPIQIFETADPNRPSGLDIYSASAVGPVTRSLTGPDNVLIDFYVATQSGTQDLKLKSASLSTAIPAGRVTSFHPTDITNASDLNLNARLVPPSASDFTVLEITVPAASASTGKIFWGKTQEGNYFRLLVLSNGTSLISGPSGSRFITVRISYQSKAGVPYATPEFEENDHGQIE